MTNIFNEIGESDLRTQINSETQINTVLDPEGWYSQNEVRGYLNPSINHNTQKGMISKAVASGKIETNGEKGKSCRVKGSSAIKWLESVQELK